MSGGKFCQADSQILSVLRSPYEETMRSCRNCWRQIAVDHLPLVVHKHHLNRLGDTMFADCVLDARRLFVLVNLSSGRKAWL